MSRRECMRSWIIWLAIKHPGIMAKGKKVVKSATNLRRVTRKTSDDAEYNQLVDLEDANEKNLSSSDSLSSTFTLLCS